MEQKEVSQELEELIKEKREVMTLQTYLDKELMANHPLAKEIRLMQREMSKQAFIKQAMRVILKHRQSEVDKKIIKFRNQHPELDYPPFFPKP